MSRPLREGRPVHGDDLRHIHDRIAIEARSASGDEHVAGCVCPPEIARDRHADDRRDRAAIERISLDDNDGTAKARGRPSGRRQVCPEHVALPDHHSTRSSACRAARVRKGSRAGLTFPTTMLSLAVTSSGSWRATYSRTASLYTRLLGFFKRRASRSASSKRSSGNEIAVFIPRV